VCLYCWRPQRQTNVLMLSLPCSARFSYSRGRRARQQLWLPSCAPQHFNARLLQPQDITAFTPQHHGLSAHDLCPEHQHTGPNPWVCDLSDPIGALSPCPLYCIAHNLAWHRLHVCNHQVPGTRPHPPAKGACGNAQLRTESHNQTITTNCTGRPRQQAAKVPRQVKPSAGWRLQRERRLLA
jgi:hypothetical protein